KPKCRNGVPTNHECPSVSVALPDLPVWALSYSSGTEKVSRWRPTLERIPRLGESNDFPGKSHHPYRSNNLSFSSVKSCGSLGQAVRRSRGFGRTLPNVHR